jgi:hypothetical protein
MPRRVDLGEYRLEAEEFLSALDREFYLHFSGRQSEYDIEPIYERHAALFSRAAVDSLRAGGPRSLLEFAVQGLIGRETKAEEAELARREAVLEIEVDGERLPYREAPVVQANEPDPERRAAIEDARNAALTERLDPLLRELLDRTHALTTELGWPSAAAMCEELSGIDLRALGAQTQAFLDATGDSYIPAVEPSLREQLGFGFERLRRSDLIAWFRGRSLDEWFPAERLVPSLSETLAGLGVDLESQPGVTLDTEQRPRKSPRAFCAPVRVPDEVYLVIARIGGRDDFAALFHEAGHTEHYAHIDRGLPVEARYLGDNSVTEGFAFLFDKLVADPAWLSRRLCIADPAPVVEHARAVELVYLRRYCAKIAYELELHGEGPVLDALPDVYARRLSDAVRVDWPRATWLADVDPFFYVARYLRAWAFEAHLTRLLRERFGEAWFEHAEAGELLRSLWARGQALNADELLGELTGETLDFSVMQAQPS